jgi:hypothetical protein
MHLFMFPLQNDYVYFDLIGTIKKIQSKVIYLSEKTTTNVWTNWVLKFSDIFFAKFKIYSVNFVIKLDPMWKFNRKSWLLRV